MTTSSLYNSCADDKFWPEIEPHIKDTSGTKRQVLKSNEGREAFCKGKA